MADKLLGDVIPNIGPDDNWWLGTTSLGVRAKAIDGKTPSIGQNGNWYIGSIDTGVPAQGPQGTSPHIGGNGDWFIGTTDTGVTARGPKGDNGAVPTIGSNDDWWIDGVDTGVSAIGEPGNTPYIGPNMHWWINGVDTGILAVGASEWGTLLGDIQSQTDLVALVATTGGVVQAATLADFPATGTTNRLYIALDTNHGYIWDGSQYVLVTTDVTDILARITSLETTVPTKLDIEFKKQGSEDWVKRDSSGVWMWDSTANRLNSVRTITDVASPVVLTYESVDGGGPNYDIDSGTKLGSRVFLAWDSHIRGNGTLRLYSTNGNTDYTFAEGDEVATHIWVGQQLSAEGGDALGSVPTHADLETIPPGPINDWVYVIDDTHIPEGGVEPIHIHETWSYSRTTTGWMALLRVNEEVIPLDNTTLEVGDGVQRIKDGGVTAAKLAADSATDTNIGTRSLVDEAGSDILVDTSGKLLTGWLQGIRNNLKGVFGWNAPDRLSALETGLVAVTTTANAAYVKPTGGIPVTDLSAAVVTSLGKADTAYQKPQNGIPKADLYSTVQTSLGKADTAYQKPGTGIPYGDIASAAWSWKNIWTPWSWNSAKVSLVSSSSYHHWYHPGLKLNVMDVNYTYNAPNPVARSDELVTASIEPYHAGGMWSVIGYCQGYTPTSGQNLSFFCIVDTSGTGIRIRLPGPLGNTTNVLVSGAIILRCIWISPNGPSTY